MTTWIFEEICKEHNEEVYMDKLHEMELRKNFDEREYERAVKEKEEVYKKALEELKNLLILTIKL